MEEDNGETLRALGIEYPAKKKSYRRAWIAGAASLAASLAVVLTCVFTLYPFGEQTEKYLEENFVTEDSTVERMNSELEPMTASAGKHYTINYPSIAMIIRFTVNSLLPAMQIINIQTSHFHCRPFLRPCRSIRSPINWTQRSTRNTALKQSRAWRRSRERRISSILRSTTSLSSMAIHSSTACNRSSMREETEHIA